MDSLAAAQLCELCAPETKKQPSKYQCSRCLKRYCSLECFRNVAHEPCSERFYEKQVKAGLQSGITHKDKVKMLRTLEKYGDDQEDGEWKYQTTIDLNRLKGSLDIRRSDLHPEDDSSDEFSQDDQEELLQLIENSTPNELLRSLSPQQRERFEKLLEQYDVVYE